MTQSSRTTETINRDNGAIREIMHQVRELTVPDRATLAVGLLGHLATLMNRSQMTKLMGELQEEVARVQDVPPARQHDGQARGEMAAGSKAETRAAAGNAEAPQRAAASQGDRTDARSGGQGARGRSGHDGVGQAGRGEFQSRELL